MRKNGKNEEIKNSGKNVQKIFEKENRKHKQVENSEKPKLNNFFFFQNRKKL